MTVTERELEAELSAVEDPTTGEDIVSMGLVKDIQISGGTATVSLAFNTPYAPDEMELGNEIRDVIEEAGLDHDLRAYAGEEEGFDEQLLPMVKNVIAVVSGKGGVGKTTVAANVAAGLKDLGARVGILDADIHGPNVPSIMPIEGEPGITPDEEVVPPRSDGVAVMSMDYLMDESDDPAILRGPMVNNVMMDFLESVEWGRLDYLVVDLPPGTGDASLNLLQTLPVGGAVIVTTPQEMAVADARKGLRLFEKHDTPILGIVENMSAFQCPSCDDDHDLFGSGEAQTICEDFDVPLLAELPVHPDFDTERGEGPTVRDDDSEMRQRLLDLTESVADRMSEVNRRKVAAESDDRGESVPTEVEADD